jgi:hypothetical protein
MGYDSGIDYYTVQWSNISENGPWKDITLSSPSITSIFFGKGDYGEPPANEIYENEGFWFRARAWDVGGLNSSWSYAATRIDTMAPNVTSLYAEDSFGNPVNNSNFAQVSHVNITSEAEDPLPGSGIANHTLWVQWTREGIFMQPYPCGPSSSCSTGLLDVGGYDEIVFWSEVVDFAGNKFVSPARTLAAHQLANFVNHDISLVLGTSYVLEVQVRNLNSVPLSTVRLTISGYQPAGFVGGSGDFSDFNISSDGTEANIMGLQAGGKGLLQVKALASGLGTEANLHLDSYGEDSSGTLTISDSDNALIHVVTPASFSGLAEWSVALLISLAIAGYLFVSGKKE